MRKKIATTNDKDSSKEPTMNCKDVQIQKKDIFRREVLDAKHQPSNFSDIFNNAKEMTLEWSDRALAIDKFSLQLFPLIFAVFMGIYSYVYLSG